MFSILILVYILDNKKQFKNPWHEKSRTDDKPVRYKTWVPALIQ